VIAGVEYDWSTKIRLASGSDNWPITWADDDHQYTSWGDGNGFNSGNTRVSLGVARIEGPWDDYTGHDVWGGSESENPAQFDGKSYGILSVDGVLYMWVSPGSDATNYTEARIARSTDHAATWTQASWRFTDDDGLVLPTFLNFGKDYAGARDDYVYSYLIELKSSGSLRVQEPGEIHLARVPKAEIMTRSEWEFFAGPDGSGGPTWSSDLNDRQPVFEDPAGVGWNVSVSYNAGLGRYLLLTEHDASFGGNLGLFDAPEPWGPWTTVSYVSDWEDAGETFFWNFANKWLSPDGRSFTLVYTGVGTEDAWHTVRGGFTVNTGGNNPPNEPSNVSATAEGQTSIRITWTDNGDPDGDDVQYYVQEVDDGGINSGWLGVGLTEWTATDLDPGTTYQFEVRGRDDGVPSLLSDWVQSNEETTEPSTNQPPNDPTGVTATVEGQTLIRITWTDNGDPDGDDIQYYVQEVDDAGINSGWLGVGVTTWTAGGLEPGTTYQFEVRGRDDGVPPLHSNWVPSNSATTEPPSGEEPPAEVTRVFARPAGATGMLVVWDPSSDPDGPAPIEYRVHNITRGTYSPWITETEYLDDGLLPGTQYVYEVKARDGDHAESDFSAASPPMRSLLRPLEGFGAETEGGLHGEPYVVTSLGDSGPGTLRDALSASDRYITFAVGGTIVLQDRILVDQNHVTIDGSNAPAPGITITRPDGVALVFDDTGGAVAHDIIVRHLRVAGSGSDNLSIDGTEGAAGASAIVLDHCSIHGAGGYNLKIVNSARDVTVQWCILGGSARNLLVTRSAGSVSLHHNLCSSSADDSPRIDGNGDAVVDVVNNVIHAWDAGGLHWQGDSAEGNLVGNVFVPTDGSLVAGAAEIVDGTSVFSSDNDVPAGASDDGTSGTRHVAPEIDEQSAEEAFFSVIAEAGAFPRDETDTGFLARAEADYASGSHGNISAPDDPDAVYEDGAVVITWPASPDTRVVGYHVYRRPEADDEVRLTATPVPDPRYEDADVTPGRAYYYRITAVDEEGLESPHSESTWVRAASVPTAIRIDRIYPNPVRSDAVLRLDIPEVGPGHPGGVRVTVDLYDVAGRRIGRVVDEFFQPGVQEVPFSISGAGVSIGPGLYVGVLEAGGHRTRTRIGVAR
jgi:fibronectin type 3 domain-containing protein